MTMRMTLKRGAVAATTALVLAAGAVGVVGAQQPPAVSPSPSAGTNSGAAGQRAQLEQQAQQRQEQFLGTLAGKLGITADRLRQAIADTRNELGVPERGLGPLTGRHGPDGPGGFHIPGGPGFGAALHLDVVAQALGITPEQLRQELPGKSLTEVARAHNVDPATVATVLKNVANTRIDQAVTVGRVTAEQATQAKQRASEAVERLMTVQLPTPGAMTRRPGVRGPRGGAGIPGAPSAAQSPAATATPATNA